MFIRFIVFVLAFSSSVSLASLGGNKYINFYIEGIAKGIERNKEFFNSSEVAVKIKILDSMVSKIGDLESGRSTKDVSQELINLEVKMLKEAVLELSKDAVAESNRWSDKYKSWLIDSLKDCGFEFVESLRVEMINDEIAREVKNLKEEYYGTDCVPHKEKVLISFIGNRYSSGGVDVKIVRDAILELSEDLLSKSRSLPYKYKERNSLLHSFAEYEIVRHFAVEMLKRDFEKGDIDKKIRVIQSLMGKPFSNSEVLAAMVKECENEIDAMEQAASHGLEIVDIGFSIKDFAELFSSDSDNNGCLEMDISKSVRYFLKACKYDKCKPILLGFARFLREDRIIQHLSRCPELAEEAYGKALIMLKDNGYPQEECLPLSKVKKYILNSVILEEKRVKEEDVEKIKALEKAEKRKRLELELNKMNEREEELRKELAKIMKKKSSIEFELRSIKD